VRYSLPPSLLDASNMLQICFNIGVHRSEVRTFACRIGEITCRIGCKFVSLTSLPIKLGQR
jgi:hypothetical protein